MCLYRASFCRSYFGLIRQTCTISSIARYNTGQSSRSAILACSAHFGNVSRPSAAVFCRSIVAYHGPCRGTQHRLTGIGILRTETPAYYSTQKKSTPGGLTDEILKAKMPPPPPQSSASSPSPTGDGASGNKTSDKSESWFSGKNAWKLGLVSLAGMGILMFGNVLILWGTPKIDEDGNEIPDEFSELPKWKGYVKRALKEVHFFTKMIQEPSSPKLLPDPLKEPWYQPPYTLVLEMTGVLVHPDWTLSTGWRFKKRPGLDYFLQQIGPPLFEVVIFTHEQGFTAFPIIDGLDPNGNIMFRLFRDATRYVNGTHVKDLSCLNRDLSKVIIVDCDSKAFSMQPQNALLLQKWNGDDNDRTLIDVAAFLRTIALSEVDDVRPVLEHYSQFDDPIAAFREKQRLLQQAQQQDQAAADSQAKKKSVVGGWSFGITGLKKS